MFAFFIYSFREAFFYSHSLFALHQRIYQSSPNGAHKKPEYFSITSTSIHSLKRFHAFAQSLISIIAHETGYYAMVHGPWPMNDKYLIEFKQKQGHKRRNEMRGRIKLMLLIRVFIYRLFFIILSFPGLVDSKERLSFVNSEFNNI